MFNLCAYVKLWLLIAVITSCDVCSASMFESTISSIRNIFCCGSVERDIIPRNISEENVRCYASKNKESGQPVGFVTGSIREESGFRNIEPYEQLETKMSDRFSVTKLTINEEINESNINELLLFLSKFKNLEELILQNCTDLESIPVDQLSRLQKLRHLELENFFMDFRYAFGYCGRGIRIGDLLKVLGISSLKSLAIKGQDITKENKDALEEEARKKGVTITFKNEIGKFL